MTNLPAFAARYVVADDAIARRRSHPADDALAEDIISLRRSTSEPSSFIVRRGNGDFILAEEEELIPGEVLSESVRLEVIKEQKNLSPSEDEEKRRQGSNSQGMGKKTPPSVPSRDAQGSAANERRQAAQRCKDSGWIGLMHPKDSVPWG